MAKTVLMRLPDVCAQTGLKRSAIYVLLDAGDFPKPVKLGPKVIAWPDYEIEQWVQQQIAKRDAQGETGAELVGLPAQFDGPVE